jgi:uncharacterized membrane protein HdeD (DUF308 family)
MMNRVSGAEPLANSAIVGGAPSWRLPIVRGVAALCLAAAVTASHRPSATWLALAFGAYCVIDGAAAVAAAYRRLLAGVPHGCLLVRGCAGVATGIALALLARGRPEPVHALIVGWAALSGVFDTTSGMCARVRIDGQAFLVLNGLVTTFLGIILAVVPPAAFPEAVDLIAVYATMAGTVLLLLGVRLAMHATPRHEATAQRVV